MLRCGSLKKKTRCVKSNTAICRSGTFSSGTRPALDSLWSKCCSPGLDRRAKCILALCAHDVARAKLALLSRGRFMVRRARRQPSHPAVKSLADVKRLTAAEIWSGSNERNPKTPSPRLRRIPLAQNNPGGIEAALSLPDSDLKLPLPQAKAFGRKNLPKTGRTINSCVFLAILR
jgi:hypothetical protein